MTKYVYSFGRGKAEGSSVMRNLLGGKGCELAEMTNLGIPVPPGFTITTQAWAHYNRAARQFPEGLWEQVASGLEKLEQDADLVLGDPKRPLLVSVRSGARVSMPGMMETVLNLGLNDATVEGLAAWTRQRALRLGLLPPLHHDVRRRGARHPARGLRRAARRGSRSGSACRPTPRCRRPSCKKLAQAFKDIVSARTGAAFPQDPREQLRLAVHAVFDSWFAKKATEYRRINNIPADWGTAVTVMSMVFGNLGETSGTGVGFTRDPRTGEQRFYAEFLANAQGEDVVAGIRTPEHIDDLKRRMPEIYDELLDDRRPPRAPLQGHAGHRVHHPGGQALPPADPRRQALGGGRGPGGRRSRARARDRPAHGAAARAAPGPEPGAAPGLRRRRQGAGDRRRAGCSPAGCRRRRARRWARSSSTPTARWSGPRPGAQVILVRAETSPEDIAGMYAAEGIVTSRGGRTSHAAVVAVGHGQALRGRAPATSSSTRSAATFEAGGRTVREGDIVSVDGATGEVILDAVETVEPAAAGLVQGAAGLGRPLPDDGRAGQRRHARRTPARPASSAPRASGWCAPSTCSSRPTASPIVREMIMAADHVSRRAARAEAPAVPARRLPRDLPGHGRAAGDDPPARSAAARVPGQSQGVPGDARGAGAPGRAQHESRRARPRSTRSSPRSTRCARPTRCSATAAAGSASPRRRSTACRCAAIMEAACTAAEQGVKVEPEIMIPLTGTVGEMKLTYENTKKVADRRAGRDGRAGEVHDRHHDRGAAGRAHRRQDRPGRRVLLVRHQRPHPDDVRLQP